MELFFLKTSFLLLYRLTFSIFLYNLFQCSFCFDCVLVVIKYFSFYVISPDCKIVILFYISVMLLTAFGRWNRMKYNIKLPFLSVFYFSFFLYLPVIDKFKEIYLNVERAKEKNNRIWLSMEIFCIESLSFHITLWFWHSFRGARRYYISSISVSCVTIFHYSKVYNGAANTKKKLKEKL